MMFRGKGWTVGGRQSAKNGHFCTFQPKKHEIPCIILDINDKEASEISLIENLQRRDLTSIEEAKGYTLLIQDHNYTHEELSEIVGKSRAHISNIIRLLSLPEKIINRLLKRELTMGQVRPLVGISNAEEIAEQVFRS